MTPKDGEYWIIRVQNKYEVAQCFQDSPQRRGWLLCGNREDFEDRGDGFIKPVSRIEMPSDT